MNMKKISKKKFIELMETEKKRQLNLLEMIDDSAEYDPFMRSLDTLIGGSFIELLAEIMNDKKGLIELWFDWWQYCNYKGDFKKEYFVDCVDDICYGEHTIKEIDIYEFSDLYDRIMFYNTEV